VELLQVWVQRSKSSRGALAPWLGMCAAALFVGRAWASLPLMSSPMFGSRLRISIVRHDVVATNIEHLFFVASPRSCHLIHSNVLASLEHQRMFSLSYYLAR
jgi:hypothetical protein